MKAVPKTAHFYWGNSSMSFIRLMTLKSFSILNPDWILRLYVPKVRDSLPTHISFENKRDFTVEDFSYHLPSIKNLQVIEIDFAKQGIPEDMSDVYKSDILRWKVLADEGGLWSDMDIIYHLPMTKLTFAKQHSTDHIIVKYNEHSKWLPIGFLLSCGNSSVYNQCYQACMSAISNKSTTYQKFGTEIFSNIVQKNGAASTIHKESVYPFVPNKSLQDIYTDKIEDTWRSRYNIGIHWFGGHPGSHDAERFASPTNLVGFGVISHALLAYEKNTKSIREQFNV